MVISIHAPAWGATKNPMQNYRLTCISIHAPAWGATLRNIMNRAWEIISIHAPAWGATEIKAGRILQQEFQSTHPHGVRPHPGGVRLELPVFQSTHPHGVRPGAVSATNTPVSNFNPRTRMGCDCTFSLCLFQFSLFQSTHPHGVRRSNTDGWIALGRFQSTHPHGVRLLCFVTFAMPW